MSTVSLQTINEEVFLATGPIVRLGIHAVEWIKGKALHNRRGRARICAHPNNLDPLHEMLIAIRSDSYIQPHRHLNKTESFHLIEGEGDVVIFDDMGAIADVVQLRKDRHFYYRLNTSQYHTLLIRTPLLVIHEVTNGPFDPLSSDFAPFAPAETSPLVPEYMNQLKQRVESDS